MKSVATTLLAGLMLLGTVAAVATSKNSTQTLGFSDGGPAPVCRPSDPNCPPPIPTVRAKVALPSDGGPAPVCRPSDPNCPPPIPTVR